MKRYSNIDFLMEMDWSIAFLLIKKANEMDIEDKLFLRWLNGNEFSYQHNISFDEFKNQTLSSSAEEESVNETMQKVKNILDMEV